MSNYLLELGAIHLVLILGYWLLLRKERQYQKMRIYLIGSSFLALIIPLLKLPKLSFGQETGVSAMELQPMTINVLPSNIAIETSIWTPELFFWIYLSISGLFLLKFLANIYQIIKLEKQSNYEKFHIFYVRRVANIQGSFTFFNWVFLNEKIDKNHEDYHVILKHEHAHVSLGHTYDLMFLELFKVCFWWTPTIWFLHKEIRKIHEYQADAYALKTYHIDQYSSILISSTLATHGLSLASSFHDGFIFKRLTAMKQKAKTVRPWKLGALTALSALLLIAFACSEELDNNIKEIGENSNAISFEQLPAEMQAELAAIKDELSFVSIAIPENDDVSKIQELKELDPETIHAMNVDRENGRVLIALRKDGNHFVILSEKSKQDGELFMVVEEHPEYIDGTPELYKYIGREIKYPLEARKNEVEGTVNVQFIIEKDGSISNVAVIDGIGYGCDEEAIRVLRAAGNFKPGVQRGRPVRVRMSMPIIFKINEKSQNQDGSQSGIIVIEELKTQPEEMKVDATYENGRWIGTISSNKNKAMPGVNVVVTGTDRGTVTDFDGRFSIEAGEDEDLNLSFVGYNTVILVP